MAIFICLLPIMSKLPHSSYPNFGIMNLAQWLATYNISDLPRLSRVYGKTFVVAISVIAVLDMAGTIDI